MVVVLHIVSRAMFYSIVVVGTLVFVIVAGKLEVVLLITVTSIAVTGAGMAQWQERSSPNNVSRVRFSDPHGHTWVECGACDCGSHSHVPLLDCTHMHTLAFFCPEKAVSAFKVENPYKQSSILILIYYSVVT